MNYNEKTGIISNLLTFIRKISGRVLRFEEKFDEKDEEFLLKQLKSDISLLNYEQIFLKDFESLETKLPGEIMNITDDPSLELTKHLLLANKTLYLYHFYKRKSKENLNIYKKQLWEILFESYKEYKIFEKKYMNGSIEQNRALDFPDFPRQLFHQLIVGDQHDGILKTTSTEIKELLKIMLEINPKSNVISIIYQYITFNIIHLACQSYD